MRSQSAGVIMGAVLLATLTATLSSVSEGAPKAQMRTEPSFVDFGVVRAGHTVEQEVTIRNLGTASAVVRAVSSSCGCVRVNAADLVDPIVPGERRIIRVRFAAGSRSGRTRMQVLMETEEKSATVLALDVLADVAVPFDVSRETLEFAAGPGGTRASASAIVTGPKATAWTVLGVRSARGVEYQWVVADEAANNRRILTLNRVAEPSGAYDDQVTILTSDAELPSLFLTCVGRVTTRIRAMPARLPMGLVREADRTAPVVVVDEENAPFDITAVHFVGSEPPEKAQAPFTATWTRESASRWTISVRGAADGSAGRVHREMVVQLSGADVAEIRVPVDMTRARR